MKTVNVAKLKNELSLYLRFVRKGEAILIRDRKTPIAKIVPVKLDEGEEGELSSLASSGVVRLGDVVGGTPESFYGMRNTRKLRVNLSDLIREDRNER